MLQSGQVRAAGGIVHSMCTHFQAGAATADVWGQWHDCNDPVVANRAEQLAEGVTRLTYFGLSAKSMLCPKQQNLVRTCTLLLAPGLLCRYFPMMPSDGPYMSATCSSRFSLCRQQCAALICLPTGPEQRRPMQLAWSPGTSKGKTARGAHLQCQRS